MIMRIKSIASLLIVFGLLLQINSGIAAAQVGRDARATSINPQPAQDRTGRKPSTTTPPKQGNPVDDLDSGGIQINFERIGLLMFTRLQNKCVGYGFAIFHNGKLIKHGNGGFARRSPDTTPKHELPFEDDTRIDIASCTKTVVAIAVLKALEMKGKTDAELIYKYLPTNWKVPASVKALTFQDLLSHHSGLKKSDSGDYDGMRKVIEAGVSPDYDPEDGDYQNINFAMCRILLPYIIAAPQMKPFENDPKKAGLVTAAAFSQFIRDYVFKPAGINKPIQFKPWHESGDLSKLALHYSYQDATVAGLEPHDHTLDAGAGGLYVNAIELAQVMAALENNKLLAVNTRQMMKQHNLGIFRVGNSAYWTHNGGFKDNKGRGIGSRLVLCPNNIQIAIVINSASNATGDTFDIVRDAVEDSVSKQFKP